MTRRQLARIYILSGWLSAVSAALFLFADYPAPGVLCAVTAAVLWYTAHRHRNRSGD
jgi:hypothetical protein